MIFHFHFHSIITLSKRKYPRNFDTQNVSRRMNLRSMKGRRESVETPTVSASVDIPISEDNIGLCSSINKAAKLVSNRYILYSHDDMYFCPDWDKVLLDEVKSLNHDNFYLSGTMIEPNSGHIIYDFGIDLDTFKEDELLSKYKNINSNKEDFRDIR